jgi:hypothetical protein
VSFSILEGCGFFSRLEEFLSKGEITTNYLEALSQLILNLTMIDVNFMRTELLKGTIINTLISISEPRLLLNHTSQSNLLNLIREQDYYICNELSLSSIVKNVLQIIRLLSYGSEEMARELVNKTKIIALIASNIHYSWDITKSTQTFHENVVISFLLLSELLSELSEQDAMQLFSPGMTGIKMFELLLYGIQVKDQEIRMFCHMLLSKILSIHYVGIIDLKIEDILIRNSELEVSKIGVECSNMASKLVEYIFDAAFIDVNSDPKLKESLHISLKCLLGKSKISKSCALKGFTEF